MSDEGSWRLNRERFGWRTEVPQTLLFGILAFYNTHPRDSRAISDLGKALMTARVEEYGKVGRHVNG